MADEQANNLLKWGRNYKLSIVMQNGTTVAINYPLTISFNITRNMLQSLNTASIQIYNLSKEHREALYHDFFSFTIYDKILLEAGYGNSLSVVFCGNIRQSFSERRGTDWITSIEAWDGGFDMWNATSDLQFTEGYSKHDAIDWLSKDFKKVKVGAISDFSSEKITGDNRSMTVSDPSWKKIKDINPTGFNFIDGERLYSLSDNEVIKSNTAYKIDASSGLLGTPRRNNYCISVTTMFEPRLNVGRFVDLDCSVEQFQGRFQIAGIHHQGTMGEGAGGNCVTIFDLYIGTAKWKEITGANQ